MSWLSMVGLVGQNGKTDPVLDRVRYDSQAFKLLYISNNFN